MISTEEAKKIARLAKLQVSEAEAELYAQQLSAILDYMEQLKALKVDSKHIDWRALMPDFSNRMGEDISYDWPEDEREMALAQAERERGLVKVKPVL